MISEKGAVELARELLQALGHTPTEKLVMAVAEYVRHRVNADELGQVIEQKESVSRLVFGKAIDKGKR